MEKRQLNTGDRITTASLREEDAVSEPKLRPITLDTYIGQEKVKENMRIYMQAAKQRGECLDHVYFMDHRDWERLHFQIL